MTRNNIETSGQSPGSLELLGKRVSLSTPYRPEEDGWKYGKDWIGYEFGIVVEVISHEYDRQLRQKQPKNVSLHLFDQEGRLYIIGKRDTTPIPGFVDFHISEFVLCLDNMSLSS